jgi:ribonuclease HI
MTKLTYDQSIVLYSDGGSKDNYSGYGIHGYVYSKEPIKKGNGNSTQVLTDIGYVPKTDIKKTNLEEVKPIEYIDAFGTIAGNSTNNAAELKGVIESLKIANRYEVNKCTIYTDSQYVVKGTNEYISKWKSKNWVKSDGTEVINKEYWIDLDKRLSEIKRKNVELNIQWIKGHDNNLGNDIADKSATIARMHTQANIHRHSVTKSPSQGYWVHKKDKHPLLCSKKLYFSTKTAINEPGKYYCGDHGKRDDLIAKKNSDGCICYIELDTPDVLVERLITKHVDIAEEHDTIVSANLHRLFSQDISNNLYRYEDINLLQTDPNKFDLYFIDVAPISKSIYPPQLAHRLVNELCDLKELFLEYKQSKTNEGIYLETDITNYFYELNSKGNTVIKSELDTGLEKLKVDIGYRDGTLLKKVAIDLYMGTDLPVRNTLKKLESSNPNITLISIVESDFSFRYVVILKTSIGEGIWRSLYGNIKLFTPSF